MTPAAHEVKPGSRDPAGDNAAVDDGNDRVVARCQHQSRLLDAVEETQARPADDGTQLEHVAAEAWRSEEPGDGLSLRQLRPPPGGATVQAGRDRFEERGGGGGGGRGPADTGAGGCGDG